MSTEVSTLSTLHLAVTPSLRQLPHCAALLQSVFAHTRGCRIEIHLLHEASLDVGELARFVESLGGIAHDHPLDAAELSALPEHDYFPKSDWLKIFAARCIAVDQVLVLDSELIVMDDLWPLWSEPLEGRLLAAVPEAMWFNSTRYGVHSHMGRLGLQGEDYFNTGLLLMNLAAMRQQDTTEKLLACAQVPDASNRLAVQDALNVVMQGQWKRLPMKWCVHKVVSMNHRLEVPLPENELQEARYRPAVVHFCSPDKPWYPNSQHPFRPAYIRHRQRTPWADGLYQRMDLLTYLYLHLPQRLRLYIYSWVPPTRTPWQVLWHYRYLLSPRYQGGALLQRLPPQFAQRIRGLGGRRHGS